MLDDDGSDRGHEAQQLAGMAAPAPASAPPAPAPDDGGDEAQQQAGVHAHAPAAPDDGLGLFNALPLQMLERILTDDLDASGRAKAFSLSKAMAAAVVACARGPPRLQLALPHGVRRHPQWGVGQEARRISDAARAAWMLGRPGALPDALLQGGWHLEVKRESVSTPTLPGVRSSVVRARCLPPSQGETTCPQPSAQARGRRRQQRHPHAP